MPRVYKRKTEKKYTLETLQTALSEIKGTKISLRRAEEKYNIPRATLFDQLKKSAEVVRDPKRGKKPIFNDSQEEELVEFILKSCRNYFGITTLTLRKVAFDFATANGLAHNFNRATGMAGKDWYYSFMSRHPEISLRRPEATSLSRITAFNEEEVDIFFTNLTRLMSKHHFRPDAIYNVDETGISTVQRNSRILAPKGLKQVGKCTSAERGALTTVINACSATGNYVPPFFIFKRKRMNPLLMKQSNSNMAASISDSGWINEELFVHWLQHFKSYTRPSADNQILLILDNHESHISLSAYNFCKKNFIYVVTLPPHTSHKMQPLDLTFNGPLKTAYNRECETHMVNNPGAKITGYDVVGLYTKAFNRTTNIEKAVNGFRAAGICLLDKDMFRTTFSNFGEIEPQSNPNIKPSASNLNNPRTQNELDVTSLNEQANFDVNVQTLDNVGTSSALRANGSQIRTLINNQSETEATPYVLNQSINDTSHHDVSIEQLQLPPTSVPLSDIVNVPTIKSPSKKRIQKKKHSMIFTNTPEKIELEKKEMKKVEKRIKQEAGVKKGKQTVTKQKIAEKQKIEKGKSRKGVKNLKNFENTENITEYFCIFCTEKYSSPPTEDWIMCMMCQNWAHENCTGGSSSRGYICDLCKEK